MTRAERKKLRQQMEALAKKHGKTLDEDLIKAVFWFVEECERHGECVELLGATSGEGFFEFDLQRHKIR